MVCWDFSYDLMFIMRKVDEKTFATVADIPVKTFADPFAFEEFTMQ